MTPVKRYESKRSRRPPWPGMSVPESCESRDKEQSVQWDMVLTRPAPSRKSTGLVGVLPYSTQA